jgi:hypothetical protein
MNPQAHHFVYLLRHFAGSPCASRMCGALASLESVRQEAKA